MTIEKEYFHRYSTERYNMIHLTHLTPYRKQYNYSQGNYIRYNELRNETGYISGVIRRIIEFAIKINRYDILSRYQDHNNSPTARNMHSCELCFIYGNDVMSYHLYWNYLIKIGELPKENDFLPQRLYIFGVSDVLNTSRFYSEFSLYLTILDAGHLLFNVKMILEEKQIKSFQQFHYYSQQLLNVMGRSMETAFIPFMLEADATDAVNDLKFENHLDFEKDIVSARMFNEIAATDYMVEIIRELNSKVRKMETRSIDGIWRCADIGELCRMRNSGHTMVGNYNLAERFENFSIPEACQIIEKSKPAFSCPQVSYAFIRISKENVSIYLHDRVIEDLPENAKLILYNDHQFFDVPTYRYIAVCYVSTDLLDKYGITNLIMSCGELMQLIGLYTASVRYAFRPMKNHNDNQLKKMLCLDECCEIVYIGVVCNSSINQLSFPID